MKRIVLITWVGLFLMIGLLTINSCKKEGNLTGIEATMYAMAIDTTGYAWYKDSDTLMAKSSNSGHQFPFLRTRYNIAAASRLDTSGMVIPGSVFPDGAMIVKELVNADGTLGRYAILYKQTGNENADSNGWVWGYINADKTVAYASSNKGAECIDCHRDVGNIDQTLMNVSFP